MKRIFNFAVEILMVVLMLAMMILPLVAVYILCK